MLDHAVKNNIPVEINWSILEVPAYQLRIYHTQRMFWQQSCLSSLGYVQIKEEEEEERIREKEINLC